MPNIIDILARALSLRQETALNSITPNRAGGIMYDTLLVLNQMQLEGGSLLISKVYASVSAMEADTTPTSDLTGRALKPGQLVVIVTSDSSSSDMGSEYRFNGPGSWTYVGKVGGLPLDTVPTQSSTKGITSGGVYAALAAMKAEGYKYMGLATPGSGGTAPGTPNQPVFYIAGPGSYPNFGSITVASGYLGFIKYSSGTWTVESVAVGKDYDEQISQLDGEISQLAIEVNGGEAYQDLVSQLQANTYCNTNQNSIFPNGHSDTTGVYSLLLIGLTAGQKFRIHGLGGNNYVRLWATGNSSREFVRCADTDVNARTTPVEITIQNGEDRLCVNLSSYNSATDKVESVFTTEGLIDKVEGLEERVETLENLDIPEVSDETGSSSSIAASQKLVTQVIDEVSRVDGEVRGLASIVSQFLKEDTFTLSNFVDGYTNTNGKSIGDVIEKSGSTDPATSATNGQLVIPVKAGNTVSLKLRTLSNKYCLAWILTDTTWHVLSWSEPGGQGSGSITYNWLTDPKVLNIENDGYLFVQYVQSEGAYASQIEVKRNSVINLEDVVEQVAEQVVEEAIEELGIKEEIEVCVPDTIFAVVGDTLQLYYRSIFRCVDYSKYSIRVVCNIGAQYPKYYEVTPLAGNVGTHTLTFTIKDNNDNVLGTKEVDLVVVPAGTSPASELNVLCIGASGTNDGEWASELKRRLIGSGGNPEASGKTNIQFVGRMSKTYDGQQVNLEATGGYQFSSYTSLNTARYRFNVTAENEPTISIGDVYSNNGCEYTVREININAGNGGYFSCDGTGAPQSSGTLTKVSGTGSESIVYGSSSFSGNPFVYDGVIDVQQYADDFCNPQNAAHGRIDVVYTELFGNGTTIYTNDFTSRLSEMQAFIDQIRAVFPNCKFCIGLFWLPDLKGGLGVNYGAKGAWSDGYGIKYTNMNLCNALQKYITDNNLSSYVCILNWLNEFDQENNFRQTAKALNVRYATLMTPVTRVSDMVDTSKVYLLTNFAGNFTPGAYIYNGGSWIPKEGYAEIFGENGIHPSTRVGYYQMADTAWRLFIAKFCQS